MDTDAMFRLILGLEKRISIIETYLADSPRFVIPGEPDVLYQQAKKVVKKAAPAKKAVKKAAPTKKSAPVKKVVKKVAPAKKAATKR